MTEKGWTAPRLKRVTLIHVENKPIGSYPFPLKYVEEYQPAQQMMMLMNYKTATHQECFHIAFFLLRMCQSDRSTIRCLTSLPENSLYSSFRMMLPCQRCTTRIWHRSLLNIKMETTYSFAISHIGNRLLKARERLLLNQCQIPNFATTEATLTMSKYP